jgi:hypothetical protein
MKFTVDVKNRSKLTEEDQSKADYQLLKILVADERPFAMVQSQSFQEFCAALNPLYKVPVHNTIMKKLDIEYENVKNKLDAMFNQLKFFSITMDGWKSKSMDSYLTLEVHYWDFQCSKKCTRTWAVFCVDDVHCTGEVIERILKQHFEKMKWDETKIQSAIITTVSDGGEETLRKPFD